MRRGTILFCGEYYGDRDSLIALAKEYIKRENYTKEQVKIVDRDNWILVIAK